jgi:hypothetical protein
MHRSINGSGTSVGSCSRSRSATVGGLVASLAIGKGDTLKGGCKGSQILIVIVGSFGWEAVTIRELTGILPKSMHRETTTLRMRASYVENRFTHVAVAVT